MRKIGLEVTRKAGSPGSEFIPVETLRLPI